MRERSTPRSQRTERARRRAWVVALILAAVLGGAAPARAENPVIAGVGMTFDLILRDGFIHARKGARDRRQRLLYLTDKGTELERQLTATQRARIARAYRVAGGQAVEGYRKVLMGLIDEPDRRALARSG